MKLVKKLLLGLALFIIVTVIAGIIYAKYELKHMYGGYTEVVDSKKFDVAAKTTAITNVSVLSPDGSHFIEGQTVLIEKGKIAAIGDELKLPENALIIDGNGKFLIPGLINSHVHIWQSPNDLLLYLANGITQIREMMGTPAHLKLRKEIEEGKRLGPKMFVASSKVQTFGAFEGWLKKWTRGNINLTNPNNTESLLQSISDQGYDAIKLGSHLDKENYRALNNAAKKTDIPLIGHLSLHVSLKDLWNSNQKELAHIEEIVKALRSEFGKVTIENRKEFLQFVEKRGDEVADNLLKKDITVTSTVWLSNNFVKQKFDLENQLKAVELSYVNPGLLEGTVLASKALGWLPKVNRYRMPKNLTKEQLARQKNFWSAYAEAHDILVRVLTKKGVKILAGTDTNVPLAVPGFSLHDELKTLTRTGMTPSEAILSATAAPSDWMKIKSGKISPDYRADLVLLNKNPLEKIENTKTINSVIMNGKVFDRKQLDAILKAVKEANNRSRNNDISEFTN